jgi:hypothetical protein
MKLLLPLALFALAATSFARAEEPDNRLYELRVYYAHPGKLDALHARFRDHTVRLFEKHGMANVGYWVPEGENSERELIYVLAFADMKAREKAFADFLADPEWKAAQQASEAGGPLVAKRDSTFLAATDYSPKIEPEAKGDRVFELRTYTASPGNLERLHERFRKHTTKLFEKHGMTNVAYFKLQPDQKGTDDTLVYLLAHRSPEAAKASFGAFGQDPDWRAARQASEAAGGGSLTTPDGVKSRFLVPTDYSPTK